MAEDHSDEQILDALAFGEDILSQIGAKTIFSYVAMAMTSREIGNICGVPAAAVDVYLANPKYARTLARARGRSSHAALDRALDVLEEAARNPKTNARIAEKISNLWVLKSRAYAMGYTGIYIPPKAEGDLVEQEEASLMLNPVSKPTVFTEVTKTRATSIKMVSNK